MIVMIREKAKGKPKMKRERKVAFLYPKGVLRRPVITSPYVSISIGTGARDQLLANVVTEACMYVSRTNASNTNLLWSAPMTDSKWFHESGRWNQTQRRPNACNTTKL